MANYLNKWNKNRVDNKIVSESINKSIENILTYKKEISKLEKSIDLNDSRIPYLKIYLTHYKDEIKNECLELKKIAPSHHSLKLCD